MKKLNFICMAIIMPIVLTGCSNNSETENLRKQVSELQQQISDMNQSASAQQTDVPQNNDTSQTEPSATYSYSMDELNSMVDTYIDKADNIISNGKNSDIEQYISLKQEHNEIERNLEIHEDELEAQYHNNTISRDEYRNLEFELERLEDRLDSSEEQLEQIFGIDD